MRVSELLASTVVDEKGRNLGPVRDVRVKAEGLRVSGIVIGRGRFAALGHAWGFAEGRAQGPWLFGFLMRDAVRRAEFVPADRIVDWGPGTIRIRSSP
jgi:sporulation protein YlmC with PRC-barrel domain